MDDPLDAGDAESELVRAEANRWWTETMSTRLNNPKTGTKVVIMQRLHENDLTGYLLAKDHRYEHLCLPMRHETNHPTPSKTTFDFKDPRKTDGELLFPSRVPEDALQDLEADMGSYSVAGQLQQRPAPRDSGMFKRSWFEIVQEPLGKIKHTVRHWDLASTEKRAGNDPDWTVGVKMGIDDRGILYVMDIVRMRESAAKVENAIKDCARQDGYSTIISLPQDPGQAGKVQSEYLKKELAGIFAGRVYTERESGNKITRAEPAEAQAEAGAIKLIRAHWNDPFLNELETFPNGRYDDQVDAFSGAVARLLVFKKKKSLFNLANLTQPNRWREAM
jgi:predicted phage terminase large subunit-like protein